jgi:hypothetical protein
MTQSRYRFIEWLDLDNTGLLSECAILKKFDNGDVFFIPLSALDVIDKQRLKAILVDRTAQLYDELWKVLEQKTLGNGMNALLYFNQLAKQLTPSGQILPFGSNKQTATRIQMQAAPAPAPIAGGVEPSPVPVAQPQVTPAEQVPAFDTTPPAPKVTGRR